MLEPNLKMPPKKSCLAKKRKYWYKPKDSNEKKSDSSISTIHIENEDPEFIIANEEEVVLSVSPNKRFELLDHNYSALTEVSPNVLVNQFADSSVNTEPVLINSFSENSSVSKSTPYVPNQYESLQRDLQSVSNFKPFLLNTNSALIQFIELYSSVDKQGVKWTVTIDEHFKGKIIIHNVAVSNEHEFWFGLPAKFKTVKDILKLLDKLSNFSVCCGNPDQEYQDLVPVGVGLSDNKSPGIIAYREGDFAAQKGTLSYSSTIRSTCCSFLVAGSRCSPCSRYRDNLRKRKQRIEKRKSTPINYVRNTYKHTDMDRDTLILKLKQQKNEIKTLEQENMKIKRNFQQVINSTGVLLNETESRDMGDLMKLCSEDVEKAYPNPNSLQRLFWEQQLRSSKDNASRSMRWHPMIVRWCLFMRQKSTKAYDAMRESGFINLPSSRTLYDYSHYTKSTLGIQPDVIKMLKTECLSVH
ncbi:hypothetical protein KUTeg_011313 [Tegillarca granosa]|uniref:Uncharacterized protein n=1 Tax=Tegillarca granosa TaxID=220873 RepID=A0ABQ9F152_TEGGR|nr:hypothetical protein KUTeg_011313 [Tegillarca granosa]